MQAVTAVDKAAGFVTGRTAIRAAVGTAALACTVLLGACAGTGPIDPKYVDRGTPENPRVCRTITPIGTRIGQRTCMLQSEWDAMDNNASTAVRDIQSRSAASGQVVAQD